MSRSLASLALIALAVLAPSAAPAQDKTQTRGGLRLQLKQGDTFRYTFTWTMEDKKELPGMPLEETKEVAYVLDQRVTEVGADGLATIQATFADIRARMGAGMMGEITFDSKTDTTDNPVAWLRHINGKTISYKMRPTGEVTEVTGGDAMRTEVSKAIREEVQAQARQGGGMGGGGGEMPMGMDPAAMVEMIAGQVTVVFTDAALRSSLEAVNHVLPDAADKKEGDTWTRPFEERLPAVGTIRFGAEYAFRGAAQGNARIALRAADEVTMEKDPGEPSNDPTVEMMRQMQRSMTENLEIKRKSVSGAASFDMNAGRLLDSEVVHEFEMEGPLPPMMRAMMGDQGGADPKMKQQITLTLRYVQDEGAPAAPQTPGRPGERF